MNDLVLVVVLLILMLVVEIYSCIKAWRKKKLKYVLKMFSNRVSWLLWFVFFLYIMIGSATLLPIIKEWSLTLGTPESSPLAIWLLHEGYSLAWIAITILLVLWMGVKFKEPFKYNDKEKEWQKEENIKFRNKLPVGLKWLAGKEDRC